MELIEGQRTLVQIRAALITLPEGLESALHHTMNRILSQAKEDVEIAVQTLSWIHFAKRRLQTVEVLHALAAKPGMSGGFEENLLLEDDVVSCCAGLVDVIKPYEGHREFAFTRACRFLLVYY